MGDTVDSPAGPFESCGEVPQCIDKLINPTVTSPPRDTIASNRTSTVCFEQVEKQTISNLVEKDSSQSVNGELTAKIQSGLNLGAIRKTTELREAHESQTLAVKDLQNSAMYSKTKNSGGNNGGLKWSSHRQKGNQFEPIKSKVIDRIVSTSDLGYRVMVLMRGLQGSGKSTTARHIIDRTMAGDYRNHIFSADDFFYDINDRYVFVVENLKDAHVFNHRRVRERASCGWSPIIVDNTHIRLWEMFEYCKIATDNGYRLEIVEPLTSWAWSPGRLAIKNIHGVPKESIEKSTGNYESLKGADDLLRIANAIYKMPMPQKRQHPPIVEQELPRWSQSKDARANRFVPDVVTEPMPAETVTDLNWPIPPSYESNPSVFGVISMANGWTSHEKEHEVFWRSTAESDKKDINSEVMPLPKRAPIEEKEVGILKVGDANVGCTKTNTEPEKIVDGKKRESLAKHRLGCVNENRSFVQIRSIYPSVPIDFLWDLFENCEGDGDWTMDILLKDESKIDEYKTTSTKGKIRHFTCVCDTPKPLKTEINWQDGQWVADELPVMNGEPEAVPNIQPQQQRTKVPLKKERLVVSEELLNAKRKIEEHIKIGDQHYSTRMRKVRDSRHGVEKETPIKEVAKPEEELIAAPDSETSSENDGNEFIEITLGVNLVTQLDGMFGLDNLRGSSESTLKTNVFMPKCMAQQLYALWIESHYNQVEEQRQQAIKEDEEFAKALNAEQKYPELMRQTKSTNLRDIMDMEYAWAAYKAETEQWKQSTPQDLASKLSRDKLMQIFPNVNKDILLEILAAHNNKFLETIDVLKDSLPKNLDVQMAKDGRVLFEQAKSELELESTELKQKDLPRVVLARSTESHANKRNAANVEEEKRSAVFNFEDCRNFALHHNQLKSECYIKARDSIQRGDHSVALYYSQIADLHKSKVEYYNQKAANYIMEIQSLSQDNQDVLDLHYLLSAEALECLDIFLDNHLEKMKSIPNSHSKDLLIITGRGLHSAGGFPAIKFKVRSRLKERNLRFTEVNPGLLKVKLYAMSKFANQI